MQESPNSFVKKSDQKLLKTIISALNPLLPISVIEEHMFLLSFKIGEDKHFLGNMVSQE